ncbi:MAG: CFI-box-CTERM domain-containing protein [Candidatus Xenobiia bacterium LiM19]
MIKFVGGGNPKSYLSLIRHDFGGIKLWKGLLLLKGVEFVSFSIKEGKSQIKFREDDSLSLDNAEAIKCDYCGDEANLGYIEVKVPPPPGAMDLNKLVERIALTCPKCEQKQLLNVIYDSESRSSYAEVKWHNLLYICQKCERIIDPREGYYFYSYSISAAMPHYAFFHLTCLPEEIRAKETAPPKQFSPPPKGSNCFIATACCGSHQSPEVLILREYRDTDLQKKALGRLFVRIYDTVSPPIAAAIAKSDIAKRLTRKMLISPLVVLVQKLNEKRGRYKEQ